VNKISALILLGILAFSTAGCVSAERIAKAREEIAELRGKIEQARIAVTHGAKLAKTIEETMPKVNGHVAQMAESDPALKEFAKEFDKLTETLIELAERVDEPAEKILKALRDADKALEQIDRFLEGISKIPAIFEGIRNTFVEAAGSTPLGKMLAAGFGILAATAAAGGKS
jgi:uncharacterized coiled-coil DUF342 family protein